MLTAQQIRLAGRIRKIVRLAALPEMDEAAVKLNDNLTGAEMTEAKQWALAFELAARAGDRHLYTLAGEYSEQIKNLC